MLSSSILQFSLQSGDSSLQKHGMEEWVAGSVCTVERRCRSSSLRAGPRVESLSDIVDVGRRADPRAQADGRTLWRGAFHRCRAAVVAFVLVLSPLHFPLLHFALVKVEGEERDGDHTEYQRHQHDKNHRRREGVH